MRRLVLVAAIVGAGLVGVAAPATAEPTVNFFDGCGFVAVSGGDLVSETVTVSKNGSRLFQKVGDGQPRNWGVNVGTVPGDLVRVVITGGGITPPTSHTYQPPAGCTAPAPVIQLMRVCHDTVAMRTVLAGELPARGFTLRNEATGGRVGVMTIAPGETVVPLHAAPGQVVLLEQEVFSEFQVIAIWARVTYSRLAGCDPEAVDVAFVDQCGQTEVRVTSSNTLHHVFWIDQDETFGLVHSAATAVHVTPTLQGQVLRVSVVVGDLIGSDPPSALLLVAEHTHVEPPTCLQR